MKPPRTDRERYITEQCWFGIGCLLAWAVVIMACAKACARGAEVKLAWNPNPEPDIAGYQILVGTTAGDFPRVIPVGNVTAATITDLDDGQYYFFSLQAINTAGVLSDPAAAISHLIIPDSPELLCEGWIVTASSEETVREDNAAANAIDGNPATLWHTTWGLTLPPHFLRIELPRTALLSGLRYLPRQDGGTNGIVTGYDIETSGDGETWQPMATGTWPADAAEKYAALPLHAARFVRLWGNDSRMAAAELWLHGSYQPEPVATVKLTFQQSPDLSDWSDLSDITVPRQARQFFRLKIETP